MFERGSDYISYCLQRKTIFVYLGTRSSENSSVNLRSRLIILHHSLHLHSNMILYYSYGDLSITCIYACLIHFFLWQQSNSMIILNTGLVCTKSELKYSNYCEVIVKLKEKSPCSPANAMSIIDHIDLSYKLCVKEK